MNYTASDLVSFCLTYIKEFVLEGDLIQLTAQSERINTSNDINNWLSSLKNILGTRKYNTMKFEFERSHMVDIGFESQIPNLYEEWLNYINQY